MVFFTCNECGTAIKKNQVEKHSFQCRNCKSVSCIDCNKEFWGDDYKSHIKCVTEDQRYGGKNYQPKASNNKNEIKQEKWIEHIKSTLSTKKITGPLLDLMERVITYTNIPRKQAKFKNFLQNSLKVRNERLIANAWEIFASSTKEETKSPSTPLNGVENGTSDGNNGTNSTNGTELSSSCKKRSAESDADENPLKKNRQESSQDKDGSNINPFDWCGISEKLLQAFPSGISAKKLRKQVIKEYKASLSGKCELSNADLKQIFRKELSNSPLFSLYTDESRLSEKK